MMQWTLVVRTGSQVVEIDLGSPISYATYYEGRDAMERLLAELTPTRSKTSYTLRITMVK